MRTVMFSTARGKLSALLDQVSRDRVAVEILRRDKPSGVLIDKNEYESLMETLHLYSSPANIERLIDAMDELDKAEYRQSDLID